MSTTEAPPTEQDAKQPEEKPKCLSKEQVLKNCEAIAEILEHSRIVYSESIKEERDRDSLSTTGMLNAVLGELAQVRDCPTLSEVHRRLGRFHLMLAAVSSGSRMDPINNLLKTTMTLTTHVSPVIAFVNAVLSEGEYELRLVKVEKPAPPAAVDEEPAEISEDLPL